MRMVVSLMLIFFFTLGCNVLFHIFFVLLGWNSFQMVFVMYAITYVSIYSLIFWGSTMEAILVCVGPTLSTCHLTGLCLDFKYLWDYLTDKLTDAGKWANCVEFQGFFFSYWEVYHHWSLLFQLNAEYYFYPQFLYILLIFWWSSYEKRHVQLTSVWSAKFLESF